MPKQFLDLTGLNRVWQQINNLFQRKLVSGNNIKSINGTSILGAGNIDTPNTTYSQATADTLGLVKIGATSLGSKQYAVQLNDDGQMFVDVPWSAGVIADEKVKQLAETTQVGDYESGTLWTSVLTSYTPTTGAQQNEETNFVRKTPLLYNHSEGYLLLDEGIFGDDTIMFAIGERDYNNNTTINREKCLTLTSSTISLRGKFIEADEALTEEEITAILV